MSKSGKVRVNIKERLKDNVCDLSLSEISEVPVREIALLKRVIVLDLSSNKLITLGKNFTTLTHLVKLDLSKNHIKYLPEDFGKLRHLRHLDLYDNKLQHLPLSFGNLINLRYLDLKGNPLTPALAKIVGHCLTTKECQESAKNTVKFLAHMQNEAQIAEEKFKANLNINPSTQFTDDQYSHNDDNINIDDDIRKLAAVEKTKRKPCKKSKTKTKQKPLSSAFSVSGNVSNTQEVNVDVNGTNNPAKNKNSGTYNRRATKTGKSTNALTSIFTFLILLIINILLIYMIMFKKPEIAERLVEMIPVHYRDWLLKKSEIFSLGVSDWISEFHTPPDEQ